MPSIHPDFEYDIFISYRHNDNRNGWVTEFVNALQVELAGTIKNPINIYFDQNPHDGLLESHDVDRSLQKKLKCIVFIPIISQTYCDTSSFAWEHELLPFVEMAKKDGIGMNITLSNGNVASRVLPIRIHDIDNEDTALFEKTIEGRLRSIDFVYKEKGVNRPLKPLVDDVNANEYHTVYRNQINKVANALKEIGTAVLRNETQSQHDIISPAQTTTSKKHKSSTKVITIVSIILMALLTIIAYMYSRPPSTNEISDKSIAVLPFANMSGDPNQEYFSDGISEEIINRLAQIVELKVIGRSSSFQFKGKNPDLREVGELLDVSTVLEGSIRKSGNQLRITAQLIRVSDGSHIWSKQFDREMEDIFQIQDEISLAIADQMKVSLGIINHDQVDLELYDLYLKGRSLLIARGKGVWQAIEIFNQIIEKDSTYQPAWTGLSQAWGVAPLFKTYLSDSSLRVDYKIALKNALYTAEQALRLNPNDAEAHSSIANVYRDQRNYSKALDYYNKAMEINGQSPVILEDYSQFFVIVGYNREALEYAKKMIELDPLSFNYNFVYSTALLQNGLVTESIKAMKRVIKIFPEWVPSYISLMHLFLNSNQIDSALYTIESIPGWMSNKKDRYEDAKWQLEAVKLGNNKFDFDVGNIPKDEGLAVSNKLLFAMNELNQLDTFFEFLFNFSKNKHKPLVVYCPLNPQGLIYHSERFLSDPRMKEVLNDYGLVEFWKEHGWPDRCKPIGNGDFICK